MMRIIDRTNQALGRTIARTRNVNDIRRIAIHHSATTSGNTAAFENSWRNSPGMGAPNAVGGYHEVILLNGDIELNYLPTRISHGVGGQNHDTYHICVVGNFTQTQLGGVQLQVLLDRIRFNVNRFPNVVFDRVLGHREFPNQATACPAINMSDIRNQVRQVSSPPSDSTLVHTVRSGETLSGIAQQHRTTVSELVRLNNIIDANRISVGQRLRLPTASNNNTTQTPPANTPETHTVRSGETLSGIAQQHRTTVAELQRLNNISNANVIRVGQVLRLPATSNANTNRHQVTRATPGFNTAADAQSGRNQRTTVQPGNYHVFNRSNGMINVTTRQGVPGSWINPNR